VIHLRSIRGWQLVIGLACAVALSSGTNSAGVAACVRADEPAESAHISISPEADLREMLALLGLDEAFFAGFANGEPLTDAERDKILRLLFRLRQTSRTVLAADARSLLDVNSIAADPLARRGDVYQLRIPIRRVTRHEVPEALRVALGFDHYFECQAEGLGQIYTLAVPAAWKLDQPIDENGGALAMFIKELPPLEQPAPEEEEDELRVATPSAGPPMLFVADRISWHPPTLLGYLGMDYGLFNDVRDRTALTEREAFYQMLAIARRMNPQSIEMQVRRQLKEEIETQGRLTRNRDLPAKMRADAERALERAEDGASDIVPLFNEPAKQRGRFLVLKGEALRAIKVRVDDADIVKRFGIDHYYEIEMVTPDSQNNPVVCCVAEVPPNMPLGNSIHESVRVAGFFLKSWAFDTRKSRVEAEPGSPRPLQVAPLVIGKRVELLVQPRIGTPTQSITLAAALAIVIAICGAAMWLMRRSDRRAKARLADQRGSLPEQISVDETLPASGDPS